MGVARGGGAGRAVAAASTSDPGLRLMPVRIALCLLACACWDAWRLLAGRIEDGASVVTVLILLVGLVWRLRQMRPQASVPAPLIAGLLMLYALASWTGPALLQIGAAIIAVAVTVSAD